MLCVGSSRLTFNCKKVMLAFAPNWITMYIETSFVIDDPTRESKPQVSRGFRRRLENVVFQFDVIYRLYLRLRYDASRASAPAHAILPNMVLQSRAEWREACRIAQRLHLPLHRSPERNWDHVAAALAIASTTSKDAYILDAGAEIYSNVLPALFVCGYCNLYGMNDSFAGLMRRGPIRYLPGNIARTGFPRASFDAITCMSMIEHGIPLGTYFREMFRLLKPGGVLITSAAYYPQSIDTQNKTAHGAPIRVLSKPEAEAMIAQAEASGFEPTGDLNLECIRRPIRWEEHELDYTLLIFTLRKPKPF